MGRIFDVKEARKTKKSRVLLQLLLLLLKNYGRNTPNLTRQNDELLIMRATQKKNLQNIDKKSFCF